jgi:hypothetical protein
MHQAESLPLALVAEVEALDYLCLEEQVVLVGFRAVVEVAAEQLVMEQHQAQVETAQMEW